MRAGTGPLRRVAEDARAADREETSSLQIELKMPVNIAISLETKASDVVESSLFIRYTISFHDAARSYNSN